jgi:hypothetical protein
MPLQMCVFYLLNFLKKLTVVAHDGWPHATVVGHWRLQDGFLPAWGYNNSRGPRRLGLKLPWATVNGCQNCKILNRSIILQNDKKIYKNPVWGREYGPLWASVILSYLFASYRI